ncbi:MAG: T9SS type A sorting domain-containing protein [Bacteroidales bacterium]|nr:T9SS type A sorting domain-containing protein [Bacteroidales bacterium]
MRKFLFLVLAVVLLSFMEVTAQQQIYGAPEGTEIGPSTVTQPGIISMETSKDGDFATTVYTFGNITVFSYFNGTEVSIYDSFGTLIASESLDADEYYNYLASSGIYRVESNNTFTVLVGDAITSYVNGYFAVDESGRGTSTKLNTWMMSSFDYYDDFIVFAYQDNTNFTVKNLETGSFIYGSTINEGDHVSFHDLGIVPYTTPLQVISDKPVSALSYTDQDYYIPSSNGTFAGTLFYGYSGYAGSWANSVTVTSYYDNNTVNIMNTVTKEVLDSYEMSEGQVVTEAIYDRTFWTVTSDYPVTVANIPYGVWSGSYYYMTRAIDQGGSGAGTLFYVPTVGSRIDVFSFDDDNDVTITNLGLYTDFPYSSPMEIWTGTLMEGEGYNFTSDYGSFVYKIEGTKNLSVLQSNGGAGADFMPLSYALDLPDLSVSTSDIEFSDEDIEEGDLIDITFTVHNFGNVTAENVRCEVYANDPDGPGVIPPMAIEIIDAIDPYESGEFTIPYVVPAYPEYRSIYIKADPDNDIVESNESNNKASRTLLPNTNLMPPVAVTVTAPMYLVFDQGVLTPNPFEVHYDFINNGNAMAINVVAELTLFNGLTLYEKAVQTYDIGNIDIGQTTALDVMIMANPEVQGYNFYTLTVMGDNVEAKDINSVVIVGDISGVEDHLVNVENLVSQPNPFNDFTNINYTLVNDEQITIKVMDIAGSEITTLVNENQKRGEHNVKFNPENLESGVYLLYFKAGNESVIRKIIYTK